MKGGPVLKRILKYLVIGVLLGVALLTGLQIGKLATDLIDKALPTPESTFEDDMTHFVERQKGERRLRMSTLQVFAGPARGTAVNIIKGLALSASHVCDTIELNKSTMQDFMGNMVIIEDFVRTNIFTSSADLCLIKFKPIIPLPSNKIADRNLDILFRDTYIPGFQGGEFYSNVTAEAVVKTVIGLPGYGPLRVYIFDRYVAPGHSGSGIFDKVTGQIVSILNASGYYTQDSAGAYLEDIHRFLCSPDNKLAVDLRKRAIKCEQ